MSGANRMAVAPASTCVRMPSKASPATPGATAMTSEPAPAATEKPKRTPPTMWMDAGIFNSLAGRAKTSTGSTDRPTSVPSAVAVSTRWISSRGLSSCGITSGTTTRRVS